MIDLDQMFSNNAYVHNHTHTCTCRVISQHGAHLHVAADGQAPAGPSTATSPRPRLVSRHMLGELRLLVASIWDISTVT